MGLIKLGNGETMPDRRINGSRIKLDLSDWLKIITVVIVVILAGGKIQWTVNSHSEVLAEQAKIIKTNTGLIRDNCKDIEFLKESFEKIDKKLDKIINYKYGK
jgi:hypothetical protein